MSATSNKNRHSDYLRERRLLESKLGSTFREATWARVKPFVSEYHAGLLEDWDADVVGLARELLDYQRDLQREEGNLRSETEQRTPPNGGSSETGAPAERAAPFAIELPEREQKRAAVLLEIQMRWAAEHPGVEHFREQRLGGSLLSGEEAEQAYFAPGVRNTTDEELADLGRRLGEYYNWSQGDAEWFILTGEAPTLHPLGVSYREQASVYGPDYGEITLHVAPWVSADTVKQAFLRMRSQIRGGQKPGTVSERRLEVLRFVEAEHARSGLRPGSAAMLEAFNQEHPHWSYPDHTAFLKAYREARREALYPEYHSPRRQTTPNIERQEARTRKFFEALRKRR